jgi:hypothetical protein
MTETDWLASNDPRTMLDFVRGNNPLRAECPMPPPSDRKLRLFACACCRQVWDRLTDERSQWAVKVAEWYADEEATLADLREAERNAYEACPDVNTTPLQNTVAWVLIGPVYASWCASGKGATSYAARRTIEQLELPSGTHAALLRDVIGNPFRPETLLYSDGRVSMRYRPGDAITLHKSARCPWLTLTVLALAQAAYDERRDDGTLDPDRLAILADALEEADCTEEAILRHLRGPGPHVRGCWAVDLLLSKE